MSWKLLKNSEEMTMRWIKERKPLKLFVGVSGGVDSVVLAHFIKHLVCTNKLDLKVSIIHLNHSLRGESDDEEKFVKGLAEDLDLSIISEKIPTHISTEWESNIEFMARNERSKLFHKHVKDSDLLFLGHHLDDDIEWNLLQKFRSTSVGDSTYIPRENGFIFRPFLGVPRRTLEKICSIHKLKYVEDISNLDTRFERNYVRQKIVPLIDSRFKNFREHFVFQRYLNTSSLNENFIKTQIFESSDFSSLYVSDHVTEVEDLFKLINYWLKSSFKKFNSSSGRGTISRQILKLIEALHNRKKGPLKISGGFEVFVDINCLHLMPSKKYFIKSFEKITLDESSDSLGHILQDTPLFLIENDPKCSPASAFGFGKKYDDMFVVTSGYIIKNLKTIKKRNSSLFKAYIKEISS